MALTPTSTERIKFFAKHHVVYENGNFQRKRGIPSKEICGKAMKRQKDLRTNIDKPLTSTNSLLTNSKGSPHSGVIC